VKRAAAESLAIPEKDLVVTATRNGTDGGSVRVVGQASSAEDAEAMVVALSQGAMKALGQQQVDRAAALEDQRASETTTARATRDKLLADSGYADPEQVYADVLNEANRLSLASSDPTTPLAAEARTAAAPEATRLRSQLPALRAKAEEYRVAPKKLELAEDNLNTAAKERVAAEATLASATDRDALSVGETMKVSPMSAIVQAFAAAFIATFGAGIALLFGIDGLRKRRADEATAPAGDPAAMSPAHSWALDVLGEPAAPAPERAASTPTAGPAVADGHGAWSGAAPFESDLAELGASTSATVDGFDTWGNPRSMFSKPLRANGTEPGRVERDGSSVTVADRDELDDVDADELDGFAEDLADELDDVDEPADGGDLSRRGRRRARRRS
jgi:hypothetical protein